MAFCKYCGKELEDGETCTCKRSKKHAGDAEEAPTRERIKADKSPEGKTKAILIAVCVCVVLALIAALVIVIMGWVNAYKKPVKNMIKGINRGNTELIVDSMYTDNEESELKVRAKDKGLEWESYVSDNDKTIDTIRKSKNIKKIKADIIAKEKLDGSNLANVENFYRNGYNEEVKKAYRVEVKFTVKYKDGIKTEDGWMTVAKIKDSGWVYCPEGSDQFSFMDLTTLL